VCKLVQLGSHAIAEETTSSKSSYECKLTQLGAHAIVEETTEARVKDCSKVHKRMNRQKRGKKRAKICSDSGQAPN